MEKNILGNEMGEWRHVPDLSFFDILEQEFGAETARKIVSDILAEKAWDTRENSGWRKKAERLGIDPDAARELVWSVLRDVSDDQLGRIDHRNTPDDPEFTASVAQRTTDATR